MFGLKVLHKLNQKKYRREYGCFIVEGKKGVLEAIGSELKVLQLVASRQFARDNADFAGQREMLIVDDADFAQLTETVTPSGIAAVVTMPEYGLASVMQGRKIAILEDIRDPGNLGTMIRTADWFGLDGILLVDGADPYQSKVVRASMGSIFHLPILTASLTDLAELKKAGFSIVVTRPELAGQHNISTRIDSIAGKIAVVFGNESNGTSREIDALADTALSIPKYGQAESLNVAVSFGIVISQFNT